MKLSAYQWKSYTLNRKCLYIICRILEIVMFAEIVKSVLYIHSNIREVETLLRVKICSNFKQIVDTFVWLRTAFYAKRSVEILKKITNFQCIKI